MALIAGLAVVGGSYMSQKGGKKADKAQKKGLKKAAKESEKGMKAIDAEATAAYGEQKAIVQPWYDAGKEALGELTAGIKSGKFDPGQFQFDYESFEKDPGYKFRVEQGERSMERGAAARGKLLSGQQQKALLGYGQEMGSQEYQNTFNRAAQEWGMNANRLQNNYNMLNNLNQQGAQTAGAIAGYRGNLAAMRTGAIGNNASNQMGMQNAMGQVNAQAGKRMAEMGGQIAGAGMSYFGGGSGGMGGSAGASAKQPSGGGPQYQTGNSFYSTPNYGDNEMAVDY
jgi:hypothetical protein